MRSHQRLVAEKQRRTYFPLRRDPATEEVFPLGDIMQIIRKCRRSLAAAVAIPIYIFIGLLVQPAAGEGAELYHVTHAVSLGAPDRWDYVVFDALLHRVYVAHGDRVTVVDGRDATVVGEVMKFPGGTHGIAISPTVGRGYTDDGQSGTAASFDLSTFKVSGRIAADIDADGIAFDPVSGHVFVVNGDPGTLTVIDPKDNTAVATIPAGGKLEYAVADNSGNVYVNGEARNEIVRIDTATNKVIGHWPMPGCQSPHGLAIDPATNRLFATCKNGVLIVVNSNSGETVATLPIGRGSDSAAFDPKRKLIFSANGLDGTLSIIREANPETFQSVETIKTAVTARTMSLDPQTGRLYLAAADVQPAPDHALPSRSVSTPLVDQAGHSPAPRPTIVPGSLKLLFLDPVS
jgi:YVTN family beta-propeller protein